MKALKQGAFLSLYLIPQRIGLLFFGQINYRAPLKPTLKKNNYYDYCI
jgi:hypothetical protein